MRLSLRRSTNSPTPTAGRQQQSDVERTETAAPDRHGERIGRERQRQQQRARMVEAGADRRLRLAGDRAGR